MGEAGAFKAEMLALYIPRDHRVVIEDFRREVRARVEFLVIGSRP